MSRLRSVAALVVCLIVVAVLSGLRPEPIASPRSYVAGADGWAHAPTASGRVLGAQLARSVVRPRNDEPLVTSYVFVVIELEVQVRHRVLPLGTVSIETVDGRTYRQLGESGLDTLSLTQPGFTSYGNAVFELPADRVAGATLIVGTQSDLLVIYRAQLAFPAVADGLTVQSQVRLREGRTEVTK